MLHANQPMYLRIAARAFGGSPAVDVSICFFSARRAKVRGLPEISQTFLP